MAPDEREWIPHFAMPIFDVFGDNLAGLEGKPDLSIFLQLLKFGRGPGLEARLGGIFGLLPATGRKGQEFVDLIRAIGNYLNATSKVDTATLKRAIRGCLPTEEGERVLETFAEQWIREGRKEGREEGRLRRQQILLKLLTKRSGSVTEEIKKQVEGATSEMLDDWTMRELDADEQGTALFNGR